MIRSAQVLLLFAAAGLWVSSRLTWVSLRSFDGLGQPKTSTITGAQWSTGLLPLAVLLAAAALAGLAVRGRALRAVAVLVAATCLGIGYLGVGLMVMPDVGPRGAALAGIPVLNLVGSQRHTAAALLSVAAAVLALVASGLLMRAAAYPAHPSAVPAAAREDGPGAGTPLSERAIWDALDEGGDPTEGR